MGKYKYNEQSDRNFQAEAKDLVKGLKINQLYELYEIVSTKLKQFVSEEREKELKAVKEVIEKSSDVDPYRLKRIWNGYQSEMARTARPKDGASKACRKKV